MNRFYTTWMSRLAGYACSLLALTLGVLTGCDRQADVPAEAPVVLARHIDQLLDDPTSLPRDGSPVAAATDATPVQAANPPTPVAAEVDAGATAPDVVATPDVVSPPDVVVAPDVAPTPDVQVTVDVQATPDVRTAPDVPDVIAAPDIKAAPDVAQKADVSQPIVPIPVRRDGVPVARHADETKPVAAANASKQPTTPGKPVKLSAAEKRKQAKVAAAAKKAEAKAAAKKAAAEKKKRALAAKLKAKAAKKAAAAAKKAAAWAKKHPPAAADKAAKSAPAAVQPAPVAAKPAPVAVKPAPVAVKPPVEKPIKPEPAKPAPSKPEPAKPAAAPAATGDATELFFSGKRKADAGDFKGAIEDFKGSQAARPSPRTLTALGRAYFDAGEMNSAIAVLRKAGGHDDAQLLLGTLYQQTDKPEKARKVYEEFLKAHPDHAKADWVRKMLKTL